MNKQTPDTESETNVFYATELVLAKDLEQVDQVKIQQQKELTFLHPQTYPMKYTRYSKFYYELEKLDDYAKIVPMLKRLYKGVEVNYHSVLNAVFGEREGYTCLMENLPIFLSNTKMIIITPDIWAGFTLKMVFPVLTNEQLCNLYTDKDIDDDAVFKIVSLIGIRPEDSKEEEGIIKYKKNEQNHVEQTASQETRFDFKKPIKNLVAHVAAALIETKNNQMYHTPSSGRVYIIANNKGVIVESKFCTTWSVSRTFDIDDGFNCIRKIETIESEFKQDYKEWSENFRQSDKPQFDKPILHLRGDDGVKVCL